MGLIDKILFHFPIFDRSFNYNTEELTPLELAGRTAQKVNEVVDVVNTFTDDINSREKSADITTKRKLSPTGNFTGWLNGRSVLQVLQDIADSLSLVRTLISMVNNRESIGTIYDGGLFVETDPPVITIEGGLF